MTARLYAANHPACFWRPILCPEPDAARWAEATRRAAAALPYLARTSGDEIEPLLAATLGEGQFGPRHWRLSPLKRLYYLMKPLIPRRLALRGRRLIGAILHLLDMGAIAMRASRLNRHRTLQPGESA